jgi:hypothetical protein
MSVSVRLLRAIRSVFDSTEADKLTTKEIIEELIAIEDGPWALMFEDHLKHDKLQTAAAKLAWLLKDYKRPDGEKIKPHSIRTAADRVDKGSYPFGCPIGKIRVYVRICPLYWQIPSRVAHQEERRAILICQVTAVRTFLERKARRRRGSARIEVQKGIIFLGRIAIGIASIRLWGNRYRALRGSEASKQECNERILKSSVQLNQWIHASSFLFPRRIDFPIAGLEGAKNLAGKSSPPE